jgi:hypothetical protein
MSNQDEQGPPAESAGKAERPGERTATSALDDLTNGLDLMLRAARKAVRGLDPHHIEELGRRARRSLDEFDRNAVRDLGRRAAESLDTKKIEEIANDAGRELLGVVERVTERIEASLGRTKSRTTPPAEPAPGDDSGKDHEPKGHVRVE